MGVHITNITAAGKNVKTAPETVLGKKGQHGGLLRSLLDPINYEQKNSYQE